MGCLCHCRRRSQGQAADPPGIFDGNLRPDNSAFNAAAGQMALTDLGNALPKGTSTSREPRRADHASGRRRRCSPAALAMKLDRALGNASGPSIVKCDHKLAILSIMHLMKPYVCDHIFRVAGIIRIWKTPYTTSSRSTAYMKLSA